MTQTKTPTLLALGTWFATFVAGVQLAGWTVVEGALAGLAFGILSLVCYVLALLVKETRRPY